MEDRFYRTPLFWVLMLAVLLSPVLAAAQGIVTGSLTGTVVDPQGAVVPSAKVAATELTTNRQYSTLSTSGGFISLRGLPPGTYDVRIESASFRTFVSKRVVINVGAETTLGTIRLEVGSSSETVMVEGAAPLIQPEAAQAGETFSTQQAADLPVGNGFDVLALFTPGVVTAGSNGFGNTNGADLSVNGQRSRSNNFQIDGQSNNDNSVTGPAIFFGNQDAIAEVQILTNYSAEYGRNMGSVVNYVTKNGTNLFHGTAYEVYDGNWADSLANQDKSPLFNGPNGNSFCLSGQTPGTTCDSPVVPKFVDNRFGGTIGGPIKKDKMWFFGSANFERQREGGASNPSGSLLTPTPTGFQQLQAAFPGNPAVALLKAIGPASVSKGKLSFGNFQNKPVFDGTTSANVEFGSANRFLDSIFNDYEATGRYDWQITSKDRVFARYIFQQQIVTNNTLVNAAENAEGNFVDVPSRAQQIGVDWSRSWSPSFLNQVRFSYGRTNVGFEGGAYPGCTRTSVPNGCPTRVTFADGATLNLGLNTNMPQGRRVLVYTVQDNASHLFGRHTLKFGGDYTRQDSPNVFLPNIDGAYAFADFNSFLQNAPSTITMADGNPNLPFKENDMSFYFQDEWRVKDNLTLTLGLRWEWFQQAINLLHDRTVAQQTGPHPFWDPALPLSATTVPNIPQDRNNFSPVVGFSWTPRTLKSVFGENKTVVRGGFRISYDPAFYNMFLNVATSTPTINLGQVVGCTNCLPANGQGVSARANVLPLLPLGVNPGTRTQTQVTKNFHSPYAQQWNFGVQREISSRLVAEAKYVGNHGVGNFQSINGNPAVRALFDEGFGNLLPSGVTPCMTPGAPGNFSNRGYANCNLRNVTIRDNGAYNIYHALQTRLEMRSWHGATAGVTYTFSKNIDNTSDIFNTVSGGNTITFAQNPFDPSRAERSISGIDFPHAASLYLLYEVPFFRSQKGLVGKLLGGYQINPTWRYTSGQPYTVAQTRFDGQGAAVCDPSATFSGTFSPCRPFLSNTNAPVDMVGQCTNPALADCGLVDFYTTPNFQDDPAKVTNTPISAKSVRWIINDEKSAKFFGTPFAPTRRNLDRGDTTNNVNLAVIKNTKLGERLSLEFRAIAFNVLNRQFRGVPDPVIADGNAANGGSFGNTFQNESGGDSTNRVSSGIGRRRIEVGAKVIF